MSKFTICSALLLAVSMSPAGWAADSAACRSSCADDLASCKAALLYNCDSTYKECLSGCPQETPGSGGGAKDDAVRKPEQEKAPGQDQGQGQDAGKAAPP